MFGQRVNTTMSAIAYVYDNCPLRVLMIVLLLFPFYASGQLVQVGQPDAHACDKVKVIPNLLLEASVAVEGHVEDPSGAAIVHTRIEVRQYFSALRQSPFKQTETDEHGNFSVGVLPAGKYRLLVFAPGFKQPRPLQCRGAKSCDLSVMPEVAPTDTFPESVCPPK
jgi:Carboxypeptidase regulatory-like domain